MLIKYTPEKNPLGKPEFYYMGRIRLARGVNNAPDAIKDHPSYPKMLETRAIEEVKVESNPPEEDDKPRTGRKPKEPESLRIV